jgi:signal transduction histidine kinase
MRTRRISISVLKAKTSRCSERRGVRVTEMINNLVDNAIRYTPSGGRVTVRITQDDAAHLIVNDDGPRIPVEERKRIFERFHRLARHA